MATTEITQYAGYDALDYATFRKVSVPLAVKDEVFVKHSDAVADAVGVAGEWMVIEDTNWATFEDTDGHLHDGIVGYWCRYYGDDNLVYVSNASQRISHVQLKSCECGQYGPMSWQRCHPEA